jgi:multiple sugar transport system substrate-binding protein
MKSLLKAAVVGGALMAGATGAQAEPVTIEAVHAWAGHDSFHQAVADAFMAANPDVKVVFRATPATYDDAHQALMREAVTNQLPDLYFSGFHLLPEVVTKLEARGQLTGLDDLMAAEGADWKTTNYDDAMLGLARVDGKQYGLAFNASTPILFANAELVTKAGGDPANLPDTWDGLIELAAKIGALGDEIDGMAYDVHAWPDDWLWRALIMQQGEPVTKDDGTVAFDGDTGLNALKLARRFVTEGTMQIRDYQQSRQQFAAGGIGLLFASTNSNKAFVDLIGDKFTLVTTTYPVANKERGTVPTGGNAGMITTTDPAKVAAAWRYLKFATGPEGQKVAVLGSGYMPTNKLAMGPDYLGTFYEENPNWRTSMNQIDRAEAWGGYRGTNGVKIWRMQRDLINEVMSGAKTPEEGLAEMSAETNDLLM